MLGIGSNAIDAATDATDLWKRPTNPRRSHRRCLPRRDRRINRRLCPVSHRSPQQPPPLPSNGHNDAVVAEITCLTDQGTDLTATRRTEEAETMMRRAVALAEEKLGAHHPLTPICLNNLGDFLSQNGRFDEAEPILRRAVETGEIARGKEDVETATALSNLALLFRRMGRLADAEPLYRRVLPIFERAHGPESVHVAGVLNNLSQLLQNTGRAEEAEPLARRAVGIFEEHLGPTHPSLAVALQGLAGLLVKTGRPAEAEPFSRRHVRIFQIYEETTGNEHAYKKAAVTHYAGLLVRLGLKNDQVGAWVDAALAGRDPAACPSRSRLTLRRVLTSTCWRGSPTRPAVTSTRSTRCTRRCSS